MAQTMPRKQLVLLGASAGWMLPTCWLAQFEEIHAWDIDPLASPLFRWRHGRHLQSQGIRLHLNTADGLDHLNERTREMPGAFFWFDNMLGQLRFTNEPLDALSRRLQALQKNYNMWLGAAYTTACRVARHWAPAYLCHVLACPVWPWKRRKDKPGYSRWGPSAPGWIT
jgi:hypothetical protein